MEVRCDVSGYPMEVRCECAAWGLEPRLSDLAANACSSESSRQPHSLSLAGSHRLLSPVSLLNPQVHQ